MATKTTFGKLADGAEFYNLSGEFVKINDFYAKRTETHWATSDKTWSVSPDTVVYAK